MTDMIDRLIPTDDGLLLLLLCLLAYRLYRWLWQSGRERHFGGAQPRWAASVGGLGITGMLATITLPLTAWVVVGITAASVTVGWALLGMGALVLVPVEVKLARLGTAAQRPTKALLMREWRLVLLVVAAVLWLLAFVLRVLEETPEHKYAPVYMTEPGDYLRDDEGNSGFQEYGYLEVNDKRIREMLE